MTYNVFLCILKMFNIYTWAKRIVRHKLSRYKISFVPINLKTLMGNDYFYILKY